MDLLNFRQKPVYTIQDLLDIMRILRGEGGCIWDREQNHHSIRNNFIEETYEVVEAIDTENRALLREELGDVLLQIIFHTQMEEEEGSFTFDDVCTGICQKLIHRHPHVFGDVTVEDSKQVLDNWDKLKQTEKQQETVESTMRGVSTALPGLMRACKVQKRAAKAGFCYPNIGIAMEDLKSEIAELEEALAGGALEQIADEMGDVLFAAVNVSRMAKQEPEEVLYAAVDRFIHRVARVETLANKEGMALSLCTVDELNRLWQKAKENH